jgi:hypothetical protein
MKATGGKAIKTRDFFNPQLVISKTVMASAEKKRKNDVADLSNPNYVEPQCNFREQGVCCFQARVLRIAPMFTAISTGWNSGRLRSARGRAVFR